MKRISQLLLLLAAVASLGSCQKVIDVELKDSERRYVIEGEVHDGAGPYTVMISRTGSFSGDNTFDSISGALVVISDLSTGYSDTLAEARTGVYRTQGIAGVPGRSYRLSVTIGGQTFTAVSAMPRQAVDIDTLFVRKSDFGGDFYFATPVFTDPPGTGNYYKLRQWIKDTAIDNYEVRSDAARDGQTYRSSLFYNADEGSGNPVIRNGDSMTVELQCIDKTVFDYYRTLRDVTGSNSASPANPISNMTGGALGIFNACTIRKKSARASF